MPMPSRNRTIYAAESIYAGPSPATGDFFSSGNSGVNLIKQLFRIQSANYNFNINKVPINQYGELIKSDSVVLQPPTVSLDCSYILANFQNEKNLGMRVDGVTTAISGILNKTSDERCMFIKVVPEGNDAINDTTNNQTVAVIGFGNAFISNYTSEASVGSFPTASVSFE